MKLLDFEYFKIIKEFNKIFSILYRFYTYCNICFNIFFYTLFIFLLLGQWYAFLAVGTAIVNLLRRFRFVATGSIKDIKLTTDILLRSRDGIKLSIFRTEDH